MTDHLSLVESIDALYASVVTDPEAWNEQAFADWAQDVAAGVDDRLSAKHLRRALRIAQKLGAFWLDNSSRIDTRDTWMNRVDLAIGPAAWRPTLAVAEAGLARSPSPELFAIAAERFRLVNNAPWQHGDDFDAWLHARDRDHSDRPPDGE